MTTSTSNDYPDDNPKTAVGVSKAPLHFIPPVALVHLGLAMEDGGGKYGLMNWRDKTVSSSIYYDAALRHLMAWWDGEDAASDSKVHHLGHVMACCAILLDAAENTRLNDDRPTEGHVADLFARVQRQRESAVRAGLAGLAAYENMSGAPTPKPPADANNDALKDSHRGTMPKPGTPRMRHGFRIIGNELWFEDTPLVAFESVLFPSQADRLRELVDGIEGDPEPVRRSEANLDKG